MIQKSIYVNFKIFDSFINFLIFSYLSIDKHNVYSLYIILQCYNVFKTHMLTQLTKFLFLLKQQFLSLYLM